MLQDGRSVSIGKNVTDRVLYVQDYFKGRIFIGSIIKKNPRNMSGSNGKACYTNFYVYALVSLQRQEFH